MNIAAVMAALDIWDLDYSAKHALLVVCCRADRHTGRATVSTPRVAADMKVHYDTARRALKRLVEAGYLTVDKVPGSSAVWQVTGLHTPRTDRGGGVQINRGGGVHLDRDEGVFGEVQGAPASDSTPTGPAAGNGTSARDNGWTSTTSATRGVTFEELADGTVRVARR
jgi:hypothetical protein